MKFRLAFPGDAYKLAKLHRLSSIEQPGGFMFRLGINFLTKYYKILIDDCDSVIICATDDSGEILGFVAGSLNAGARFLALKKHKFGLLIASLPEFICNPCLINEVLSRQNSGSVDESSVGYVVQTGPHMEFWAWRPDRKGGGSLQLFLKWLALMRLLGVHAVTGEVDKVNASILKAHRVLGAKIVKEFTTPDGRERFLIQYDLKLR